MNQNKKIYKTEREGQIERRQKKNLAANSAARFCIAVNFTTPPFFAY